MMGLLTLVFACVVIALLVISRHIDLQSDRQDAALLAKALENRQEIIRSHLSDSAFWGEAWNHLHENVDTRWAYDRDNLGGSLYRDFGYEGLFVLDPQGQTRYSVINGKLSDQSLSDWLGSPPPVMATREDAPTSRLFAFGGQPAIFASAPITPGSNLVADADGPRSTLIFIERLNDAKLRQLGSEYAIHQTHVLPGNSAHASNQLTLPGITPPLVLSWQQSQPGRQLVIWVLPLLLLLGGTTVMMAIWLLRNALQKARMVDENSFLLAQSRLALAASERRFRDVAEATTDWIWELDEALRFTYLSERFPNLTGYSITSWIGRPVTDFLHDEAQQLHHWLTHPGERSHRRLLHCSYLSAQGSKRYCHIVIKPVITADGVVAWRGTATDVTLEVEAQARVQYLSSHDELTGLPNRTRMREFLEGKLRAQPTLENPLAMITLDLDKFKPVNDLFGHQTGDAVLHEVSQRLRSCLQEADLVTRQGGDEFILIIAEHATPSRLEAICQRLRDEIGKPVDIAGNEIFIGASMGIATAPRDAQDAGELLRLSDIALYQAKNAGRNRWVFYNPEMAEQIVQRREMEKSLRDAIKHGQFQLLWQPRYNMKTNSIVAAEALIRWQHPQLGLVMPDQFIPLAEETGLIVDISTWVLNTACHEAQQWPTPLAISVNISAVEFHTNGLAERVASALQSSGLSASRLEIEVTENAALWNPDASLQLMQSLKAQGVRLLVDDFGTGYSSLSYLRKFPFDGIKLDRSFITGLPDTDNASLIAENIIGLGKAFSLSVTAEGVETSAQFDRLRSLRCDEVQGYLIGKPMPPQRLLALLQADTPPEYSWQFQS
ncbi:diguanylate cyclase [Enterobacterales bacterium CwR94]|nr:diguanylate cyclase [Enterobacterales bacterium CwR94]